MYIRHTICACLLIVSLGFGHSCPLFPLVLDIFAHWWSLGCGHVCTLFPLFLDIFAHCCSLGCGHICSLFPLVLGTFAHCSLGFRHICSLFPLVLDIFAHLSVGFGHTCLLVFSWFWTYLLAVSLRVCMHLRRYIYIYMHIQKHKILCVCVRVFLRGLCSRQTKRVSESPESLLFYQGRLDSPLKQETLF